MTEDNEKEKIIGDIEKSGYPVEIKATSILESNGWNVLNQQVYLDTETRKWRPIDIVAFKNVKLPDYSIYERLHVSLIIECKKSAKPWVFWVRDKRELRIFHPIAACGLIKLESKPWLHPLHLEKLADCFHYYFPRFRTIGIIPYEPFTKGKSLIFEAKNQVIKSLLYEQQQRRNFCSMKEVEEKYRRNLKATNLMFVLYPLIIFDGHLYELQYVKDKPKLSLSKYIQYLTSFGQPMAEESFVIDIVKIDFLKEYLEMLNEQTERLAKKISSLRFPTKPPTKRS